MTKRRLRKVKKHNRERKQKLYHMNQNDLDDLFYVSIVQNNVKDCKRFIQMGANVNTVRSYGSNRMHKDLPAIELILFKMHQWFYFGTDCLDLFGIYVKLFIMVVAFGVDINSKSKKLWVDRSLFDYFWFENLSETKTKNSVKAFAKMVTVMLRLGVNPELTKNFDHWYYRGNALDNLYQKISPNYLHIYLPCIREMFIRGFSVFYKKDTYALLKNKGGYQVILDMYDEWPMQMMIYCFQMKCNSFLTF